MLQFNIFFSFILLIVIDFRLFPCFAFLVLTNMLIVANFFTNHLIWEKVRSRNLYKQSSFKFQHTELTLFESSVHIFWPQKRGDCKWIQTARNSIHKEQPNEKLWVYTALGRPEGMTCISQPTSVVLKAS